MKSVAIFIFLFFLISCNSSKKTIHDNNKNTKPIIETSQIASLTNEQANLIGTTIIEDIQLYTESCKKRKKVKSTLNEIVFIEVFGKNPPQNLLKLLNEKFDSNKNFLAAKNGVSIFKSGLLIGYKSLVKHKKGYLISVSIVNHDDSTASVDLSESRTSLGGVYKTYQLKKNNSKWKISECKVNAYN